MIPDHFHFQHVQGKRVHLGLTGSIAACRGPELLRDLQKLGISVSCTLTEAAAGFITALTMRSLGADPVWCGKGDPDIDPFAHLSPGKTADLMLIAPATADILARAAGGRADDLLACQILSSQNPLLFAPAMNPAMWLAAATQDNLQTLRRRGAHIIEPDSGNMACGDQGPGRMAQIPEIVAGCLRLLSPGILDDKKVLVTLGPTWEAFDSVRVWTNRSSGRMGAAMAMAAWLAGAEVHVVQGPVDIAWPRGIAVTLVESAARMRQASMDLWPGMDMACCAAAVADFRPVAMQGKFKKKDAASGMSLQFEPNPDILAEMGAVKSGAQFLMGFCAEAEDPCAAMTEKLKTKNLDMIVGNRIDLPLQGFGGRDNQVHILDSSGRRNTLPQRPKTDIAWDVWQWAAGL